MHKSKKHLLILPLSLILFLFVILYFLSPVNKISAQQDDDSPLTEEQLVARFTNIVNQELPALEYEINNGGAVEIKVFLINAARNFINENNFSAQQKALADDGIKSFAAMVHRKSKQSATLKIKENDLIDVSVPSPEANAVPRNMITNSNANTVQSNDNTAPIQEVIANQNTEINTNSNSNVYFSKKLNKPVITMSSSWRNSFVDQPQNEESLDFKRKKVTDSVVSQAKFSLCPLIPICR